MKNIFKRKKRIYLGAKVTTSCEDKNTTYITFPDGLRLILRDGKYAGWYVCKENDNLIANGVTVQECAYWQYIEDDIDEDNNIQAYCSVCGAGDKHATSMIGKVPYCWKCGRKMMPQPPKGE